MQWMNSLMNSSDDGEIFIGLFRREAVEHHLRGSVHGALLPRPPQMSWLILSFAVAVGVLISIACLASVPDEISAYGLFAGTVLQTPDSGRDWLIRISPPTYAPDAFRLGQIIDITVRHRLVECRILHVSRERPPDLPRPITAVLITVHPSYKDRKRTPAMPLVLGEPVRVAWVAGFVHIWRLLL